jgi:hypothetical protein
MQEYSCLKLPQISNQLWCLKNEQHLNMDNIFDHQVSISPTFYEQLLRQNPFAKKLETQIVSTSRLRKELWYEKAAL